MIKLIFCLSLLSSLAYAEDPVLEDELYVEPDTQAATPTTPVLTTEPEKNQEAAEPEPTAAVAPEVSTPVLSRTEVDDDRPFIARKSHWVSTFGFEGFEYELPYEYDGERFSLDKPKRGHYGARVGFGREFHIGAGLMTTTRIDGFYAGSLFTKAKTADPDVDIEFASVKNTHQMYGGDINQSISWLFDMSAKNPIFDTLSYFTFEPFVEGGIGMARAYNRVRYTYDTGAANVQERYRNRVKDEIMYSRLGGGFNITAKTGFFFFMKAMLTDFKILERQQRGKFNEDNQPTTNIDSDEKDVDMDAVMSYSLGGGYKF